MTNDEKIKILKLACETGQSVDFESNDGTIFSSGVRSNGKDGFIFNEMGSTASPEGKISNENEVVDIEKFKSVRLE